MFGVLCSFPNLVFIESFDLSPSVFATCVDKFRSSGNKGRRSIRIEAQVRERWRLRARCAEEKEARESVKEKKRQEQHQQLVLVQSE